MPEGGVCPGHLVVLKHLFFSRIDDRNGKIVKVDGVARGKDGVGRNGNAGDHGFGRH